MKNGDIPAGPRQTRLCLLRPGRDVPYPHRAGKGVPDRIYSVPATGPKSGGGVRWWVADSYAVPILISDGSSPWPAKKVIEIGKGCGSLVLGVPSASTGT